MHEVKNKKSQKRKSNWCIHAVQNRKSNWCIHAVQNRKSHSTGHLFCFLSRKFQFCANIDYFAEVFRGLSQSLQVNNMMVSPIRRQCFVPYSYINLSDTWPCSIETKVPNESLINHLKPSGHYMYRQFNIHKLYVQPTQCIYVFCVDLRTNSDYFTIQH